MWVIIHVFQMYMFKKILMMLVLLNILFVCSSSIVCAWDDCPFGYEDDPYPGKCGRYTDTNGDGICDLSQEEPIGEDIDEDNSQGDKKNLQKQQRVENQNYSKNIILLFVSFVLVFLGVLISKFATSRDLISNTKEKIIWNLLLLVFFLPSAITGVILVLMPEFTFLREIGMNFIELHSYTSFFFMWISGYHIVWHTTYYIKCVKHLVK